MRKYLLMIASAALVLGMAGSAMAAGDVAAGEKKAKACAGCHGAKGEGKKKNPPIAGMATADFVKAMGDYSSGARDHKSMVRIAKKLSESDVANLAAYYASLK
jgi:cytochrome c553